MDYYYYILGVLCLDQYLLVNRTLQFSVLFKNSILIQMLSTTWQQLL